MFGIFLSDFKAYLELRQKEIKQDIVIKLNCQSAESGHTICLLLQQLPLYVSINPQRFY